MLTIKTYTQKCPNFSVAVYVLRNLFWKNMPSILTNLNDVFELFQDLFFAFLL